MGGSPAVDPPDRQGPVCDPFDSCRPKSHRCAPPPGLSSPGSRPRKYRRMGWSPDLDEIKPILREHINENHGTSHALAGLGRAKSAAAVMGRFWAGLHGVALDDLKDTDIIVVSHEVLAVAGTEGSARLFEELGLQWTDEAAGEFDTSSGSRPTSDGDSPSTLHHFDRDPAAVADEWRAKPGSTDGLGWVSVP